MDEFTRYLQEWAKENIRLGRPDAGDADEFLLWLHRYMDAAQVISPPELVQKHHQAAQRLIEGYS